MIPIPELAAATATVLGPYLAAGGTEAAKEVAKTAAKGLYDWVKARFEPQVADLEKTPEDADAQAALRHALKKKLENDPDLHAELSALVEEIARKSPGLVQTSTITGDGNVSNQVLGSGNQTWVGRVDKPS
jgi:hypothetical protein